MSTAAFAIRWLFRPAASPGAGQCVLWWERRRLPVNLLVGVYGIASLLIFFWAIGSTGVLRPGDDAVEPLAIIVAPVAFNICYTLDWLVEALVRAFVPGLSPKFGPRLLMLGLGFSFGVISLPAVFWVGYRLLQVLGVLR
jgi:hypothetical protein